MRILWQNEHYPDVTKGGGGAINTYYIVSALQRLGHEPAILARGDNGKPFRELVNGTTVERVPPAKMPDRLWPAWPLLEPRYVIRSLAAIGQDFDAFIGIDYSFALAVKRLFSERPLIYRVEGSRKSHDAAVNDRGNASEAAREQISFKRRCLRRLMVAENDLMERRAWNACDAIVVKSEFMKRELAELYGLRSEKVTVIPNGVDFDRYAGAQPSREIMTKIGKTDRDTRVIIFSGRLVPMKNVSFLLRAFAMMKSKNQCVLAILGEGEQRGNLEREAGELGLADKVKFVGHQTKVEEYLAAADVFVLPSTYEPFGNALVEAMAAGLACVALRPDSAIRTASNEIMRDETTGLLVPNAFPELASTLDRLVNDDTLCQRIGMAAQKHCRERYNWESCARSYLALAENSRLRTKLTQK